MKHVLRAIALTVASWIVFVIGLPVMLWWLARSKPERRGELVVDDEVTA